MKGIKYLIIIIILNSCNRKESKGTIIYPKNKQMSTEYFNVSDFKNYQIQQEKSSNINSFEKVTYKGDTIIKEYSLISSENGVEYAIETIPPVPNLFYSLKIFSEQGKIKNTIDKVFIGILDFEYGLHSFYDKEGYLTKQIDYSKQFVLIKVKFEDLLNFLSQEDIRISQIETTTKTDLKNKWFPNEENITSQMVLDKIKEIFNETMMERGKFETKILNPYNRQDIERIHIDFDSKKQIWVVVKDFSSLGKIIIHIDGKEKKIIESIYKL